MHYWGLAGTTLGASHMFVSSKNYVVSHDCCLAHPQPAMTTTSPTSRIAWEINSQALIGTHRSKEIDIRRQGKQHTNWKYNDYKAIRTFAQSPVVFVQTTWTLASTVYSMQSESFWSPASESRDKHVQMFGFDKTGRIIPYFFNETNPTQENRVQCWI